MHGPGAHLGVPGLVDQAAPVRPVALEREHDLLQGHARHLPGHVLEDALRAQVALQMARHEVLVKALQDGQPPVGTARRGRRRAPEHLVQEGARRHGQHRARGGPAIIAHEAVGRIVVPERPAGERAAAARAAVERRVDTVQPQQPGLEVAPEERSGMPASAARMTARARR